MIANDQPLRSQMIQNMITYLLDAKLYESLTEWEQNFVSSVHSQFASKGDLSNKQCEILERLYDK